MGQNLLIMWYKGWPATLRFTGGTGFWPTSRCVPFKNGETTTPTTHPPAIHQLVRGCPVMGAVLDFHLQQGTDQRFCVLAETRLVRKKGSHIVAWNFWTKQRNLTSWVFLFFQSVPRSWVYYWDDGVRTHHFMDVFPHIPIETSIWGFPS